MNTNIALLIAYSLFVAVASLCKPAFLAENTFLNSLVGNDLLSLLAVVLAITFASVANIHLALNQIVGRVFKNKVDVGQKIAGPLRADINSNAWLLFYAFLVCIFALALKSVFVDNSHVVSVSNGLALGMLLVNVLVFRDIYCTVFELASTDLAVRGAQPPDFSSDTPSAGGREE